MGRTKRLPKKPDIEGIAFNESKMTVQKSNPLQSLSETPITLAEFKILDAYLSRIDSHNEEKRFVRFERGELEKLLGVERIRKEDLNSRLDNLFQVVTIRDERKPNGFIKIGLFEKALAAQDEDGLWQVDLECTTSAMEYIFNIDNIGYLRYRLKNIVDLTSRYSYILYLYLENNRFRRSWEISIDEARRLLNCTAPSYDQYKEFNDKVLKKCARELNEKTTLRYTYTPTCKKNRKFTAIRFTVEEPPELPTASTETPEIYVESPDDAADRREEICCGFGASEFEDFTDVQLILLKNAAWSKKSEHDVERFRRSVAFEDACQYATSEYLRRCIYTAKVNGAKNLFLYVKKMIMNDDENRN